jgi:hypothetical protein
MTTHRDQTRPQRMRRDAYRATLDALIRSKDVGRFAFFDTTIEGRIYPNGMDETSGSIVDERGRVFEFWTAWDAGRGAPAFKFWREVDPAKESGAEYRRAREELGLPS